MGIPAIPLENFINKILKILSVEGSSLIPIGLKNQLQLGNILQGEVVRLLPKEKAEISIEGQKFIAEIPDLKLKLQENPRKTPSKFPFKSGHKIYIQVEKMNPEPVLKLVSSPQQKIQEKGDTTNLSRDIKPEIIKSENLRELKLPPDKIVLVTVNQIINDRSMSVNSEFNKFIVKTKNADFYRPGEKVRIQFQNVDKGFKPILIDHPDKIQKIDIELIKPYLPSRKPLGKLVGELIRDILGSPILKELNVKIDIVERLKETLKDLTPKPGRIPDEVEIKSQVNKSGIRYESKLKQLLTQPANRTIKAEIASDLKGQLLDLIQATVKSVKNHPELNPRQNFSEFQQQIKLAVDSIELNQLSSRISTQENQALVLQIPNPFNSSDKTIQLFIREDHGNDKKGRNNDKDSYDMAFFLDLSSLGNIKINAKVGPDCLLVRMDVERDDVANYILENTKDFEQRMKNNDLITTVECCVAEKVKPTKDNLVELLVSQNTSILSLKT